MDSDFVGLEEGYFSSAVVQFAPVISPKQSHNAQHGKN